MPGCDDVASLEGADLVAVYGLGREGRAITRFVHEASPDADVVVLQDTPPDAATRATAATLDVEVVAGIDAIEALLASGRVDVVVRSPGVPLRGPGLTAARTHDVAVTSGTNLWFAFERPDNVIAITGTKGKSTTSSLLSHLLAGAGRDVALLGNIGAPLLDHDRRAADHAVVVVELSSYQLADLRHPLPVGVWLNLHREHIDWHGSHEAYAADKGRIVELSQRLVANVDDAAVAAAAEGHGDLLAVSTDVEPVRLGSHTLPRAALEEALASSSLVGHHHVANLAAALTAATTVGASPTELLDHVTDFTPLPHRLQLAHDDGRQWVDDSISTIPEAAVAALRAFPSRPVTLLAGGFDRQQDHAPLVAEIAARDDVEVVTMPDTGARLADELRSRGLHSRPAADLAAAVELADAMTPPGGVVLLSPAAPSYGHFTSFEERGDQFAALARQHTEDARG